MRSEEEIRERLRDLRERKDAVRIWEKLKYDYRIKELEYVLEEI